MTLKTFKAAVSTLGTKTDYLLLAQGVRHMQGCGMSEREIYRAALATSPGLSMDTWSDEIKTAFEKHPAK
jgi:hypothetical protein